MDTYLLHKKYETPDAILVNDGDQDFWLPKSQLGDLEEKTIKGELYVDVEIPNWLAEEKGLI
jgi:hypothetical protein